MAVLKIKEGMLFMCIKRVEMNGNPSNVAYWEGRVYRSELDDYITDDGGDKYHCWGSEQASKYFVNVDDIYTLEKLPRKYGKIILRCKKTRIIIKRLSQWMWFLLDNQQCEQWPFSSIN